MLDTFAPYFDGHSALAEPLAGRYDDTDPKTADRHAQAAHDAGIDAFTYFTFFTKKRFVLDMPVRAALSAAQGSHLSVSCTWCLRLPHQFLPIPQSYDQRGLAVANNRPVPRREVGEPLSAWTIGHLVSLVGENVIRDIHLDAIANLADGLNDNELSPSDASVGMQRTYRLDLVRLLHFFEMWAIEFACHPAYLRFGGRPVLSVLNLPDFVRVYGLDGFAAILSLGKARVASIVGVQPYVIGLFTSADAKNARLAQCLPIDAATGYGLLPEWDGPPVQRYEDLVTRRVAEWYRLQANLPIPFYPVVCAGWDATVRGARVASLMSIRGFPWRPVVVGATPESFERFLNAAREFNRAQRGGHPDVIFLHAWNEWTEGAAIEPGTRFGDDFLQVVRATARSDANR